MFRRFKKYFFSGLAVFLPLALTIYVSIWALNFAESLFGKYLKPFFLENYDFYFWGLGIFTLVAVVLFCGFVVTNYFGRSIHRFAESLVLRVPLASNIYPAFKEVAKFLFSDRPGKQFEQVVLVEWPSPGLYALGFVTNKSPAVMCEKVGKELCNVLIPHVPNPMSGYIVIVPRDAIISLPWSVEDAVKFIVSGGVLDPTLIPSDETSTTPQS
jgi:uncharacterized membrane protein